MYYYYYYHHHNHHRFLLIYSTEFFSFLMFVFCVCISMFCGLHNGLYISADSE